MQATLPTLLPTPTESLLIKQLQTASVGKKSCLHRYNSKRQADT